MMNIVVNFMTIGDIRTIVLLVCCDQMSSKKNHLTTCNIVGCYYLTMVGCKGDTMHCMYYTE